MSILKSLILTGLFLSLCNCANMFKYVPQARTVKKQPRTGGVVALNLQHRSEDRELASTMMQENCSPKKSSIVEEGEVVIGTSTTASAEAEKATRHKSGKIFGMDVESGHDGAVHSTSETTQKKEWQISYRCES